MTPPAASMLYNLIIGGSRGFTVPAAAATLAASGTVKLGHQPLVQRMAFRFFGSWDASSSTGPNVRIRAMQ